MDFARLALEIRIGWNIFYANGESERQSTRWIDFAEEDVCDGIADFVSLVPRLNDRRDSVYPGHCYRRALQLDGYATWANLRERMAKNGHALTDCTTTVVLALTLPTLIINSS